MVMEDIIPGMNVQDTFGSKFTVLCVAGDGYRLPPSYRGLRYVVMTDNESGEIYTVPATPDDATRPNEKCFIGTELVNGRHEPRFSQVQ